MAEDHLMKEQGQGWFYEDYRLNVHGDYSNKAGRPYSIWNFYYTIVSNVNYIIASENTMGGDPELKNSVVGQAIQRAATLDEFQAAQTAYYYSSSEKLVYIKTAAGDASEIEIEGIYQAPYEAEHAEQANVAVNTDHEGYYGEGFVDQFASEGCAVTFTVQGRQCPASALPGCPPKLAAMRLNALQIEEIFHTLCNGSVHTHERELAEGYLTTAVGNRVGVAGQFVQREGQCIALQKVTSLNLRIARSCVIPLPPALDKLLEQHFTGLLVVGEPGSGKTTLLRTIARTLAERQRLVAVIDERGELFPPEGPLPPLERIGGVDKARAVQMALRTLAPQVILLDELGSLEETMALEQGFFSGVDFIASIHAPDAAQAQCRPQVQALLQRGMLRQLVILAGRETPGCIREVCAV